MITTLFLLCFPLAFATLVPFSTFIINNPNCTGKVSDPCIVGSNQNLLISNKDVKVGSITVFGTLVIRPSGTNPDVLVDTAFIVASGVGSFINVTATNPQTSVTIYLRRNPATYSQVPNIPQRDLFKGGRVFGGANGAKILVQGAKIVRTYALLAKNVFSNCGSQICPNPDGKTSIYVVEDVSEWDVGNDIGIAPTDEQFNVWPTMLAIRPGAYQGKIKGISKVGQLWKIDLDRPLPYYNFSATNPYPKDPTFPPIPTANYPRDAYPVFLGDPSTRIQAEVFILNRNIIITGDNFSPRWAPLPQPPWQNPNNKSTINNGWPTPWSPNFNSTAPIEGLHTILGGNNCSEYQPCHNGGGWIKIRYAKIEKAGQRGWLGRYPLHMHRLGNCPECEFSGNVVYDTQQRGIVVHSTYNALVQNNIVFKYKGAGMYVEEGTELGNTFLNNVVVCDSGVVSFTYFNSTFKNWQISTGGENFGVTQGEAGDGTCQSDSRVEFGNPAVQLGGCRVQGTDNEQADCIQQAGIWALSTTNNFIGNRIVNNYNCLYFQSTLFARGRYGTDSYLRVCPIYSHWGKVKGNVCHSHQRFGFYPDVNYPRNVNRDVSSFGYVKDLLTKPNCLDDLTTDTNWCSCRATLPNGTDNAQDVTYIEDQLDWGNGFVGQYDLADVQYLNFTSYLNNIGLYWKGSKNMKDNKSSYVKNSIFWWDQTSYPRIAPYYPNTASGFLNTPGLSGTMILENIVFKGDPNVANWISNWAPLVQAGSNGALGVNQQCKGYLSGVAEGGLCTPQILLINVDFSQIKDQGNNPGLPQPLRPTWIKFGAEAGNPFLGMVIAFDNSLCGGFKTPCPYRSILPKYTTHLLNLPGNPCNATLAPYLVNGVGYLPSNETGDWSRRFFNGITCSVQTRRLTIWGQAQGSSLNAVSLILVPPGKSKGFTMNWTAFNRAYQPDQGPCPFKPPCCQGTECAISEPRRWAEGYGAAAIPFQQFPHSNNQAWILKRADGNPVNVDKIRMVEFSDKVFDGKRFPFDTLKVRLNDLNGPLCVMNSTHDRLFMTQYGPTKEGSGSCVQEWGIVKKIRSIKRG